MGSHERSETGHGAPDDGSDMGDTRGANDMRGGASSDTSGLGTGDTSGMSATAMGGGSLGGRDNDMGGSDGDVNGSTGGRGAGSS